MTTNGRKERTITRADFGKAVRLVLERFPGTEPVTLLRLKAVLSANGIRLTEQQAREVAAACELKLIVPRKKYTLKRGDRVRRLCHQVLRIVDALEAQLDAELVRDLEESIRAIAGGKPEVDKRPMAQMALDNIDDNRDNDRRG